MVSDRDKVFTSQVWTELFKLVGVQLRFSTAYHPQTNGQTKRVNQCLEMYLRCDVSDIPKQWKSWLAQAEFWYNTNFHSALGCSPFKALYGYEPTLGITCPVPPDATPQVSEFMSSRDLHMQLLKDHLLKAQTRMKLYADKNRHDVVFQVGDSVLLKLQPYAQSSLVNRPFPKLAMKYFGPYTILERIGACAYRLDLPPTTLIHPVFHVSQLKTFVPDHTPVYSDLPVSIQLDAAEVIPEQILDRRLVQKGGTAVPQVLIKWKTLPPSSATWEDYYVIKQSFPDALAWGQASERAGGDVVAVSM